MLDRLRQTAEEGVHQGLSLPAAVDGQGLEIDGEIRHCSGPGGDAAALDRPPDRWQLGDDVRDTGGVGGEGLGLEVEDQLTLCQERSTTSRGPVVPLRGWDWLPGRQ